MHNLAAMACFLIESAALLDMGMIRLKSVACMLFEFASNIRHHDKWCHFGQCPKNWGTLLLSHFSQP